MTRPGVAMGADVEHRKHGFSLTYHAHERALLRDEAARSGLAAEVSRTMPMSGRCYGWGNCTRLRCTVAGVCERFAVMISSGQLLPGTRERICALAWLRAVHA